MTAVPPPVPPEIVEKAERAVLAMQNSPAVVTGSVYVLARVVAERVLAAVYGDIVEAAQSARSFCGTCGNYHPTIHHNCCANAQADVEAARRDALTEAADLGMCMTCEDYPAECDGVCLHCKAGELAEDVDRLTAERDAALAEVERLRAMLDAVASDVTQSLADRDRAVRDARRDALTEAAVAILSSVPYGAELNYDGTEDPGMAAYVEGIRDALHIVTDLRDATAPPRAPTASVSDQGADPRTPTTPGAVSGHSGPREEDAETFTVSEIRAAFAAASPDYWGVPCHYETTMLLALRGSRSDD